MDQRDKITSLTSTTTLTYSISPRFKMAHKYLENCYTESGFPRGGFFALLIIGILTSATLELA